MKNVKELGRGDMTEMTETVQEIMVDTVNADPDQQGRNQEAEVLLQRGAQTFGGLLVQRSSREGVSPLSRLVGTFCDDMNQNH